MSDTLRVNATKDVFPRALIDTNIFAEKLFCWTFDKIFVALDNLDDVSNNVQNLVNAQRL